MGVLRALVLVPLVTRGERIFAVLFGALLAVAVMHDCAIDIVHAWRGNHAADGGAQ